MKTLALLALALAVIAGAFLVQKKVSDKRVPAEVAQAFNTWMNQQNKKYSSPAEKAYRLSVFHKTYVRVSEHQKTQSSYQRAINMFADMTYEEVIAKYTGLKFNPSTPIITKDIPASADTNADEVDWRTEGAVNPVKNQAKCGSCWAFSAIGAIESAAKIGGKQLYDMSEQQLVDCSTSYGNNGCNGGLMTDAFRYVKDFGVEHQADYPYTAVDGKCYASKDKFIPDVKVTGSSSASDLFCSALAKGIAKQPVSVGVDVQQAFIDYKSGILDDPKCGLSLNHGIVAVGYGSQGAGKDYWIVRNSWGPTWGDQGYILMNKSSSKLYGQCGICRMADYPNLA